VAANQASGLLSATDFEFRHRFWLIGAIFGAGFWLYAFDHVNVVQWVIDRTVGEESSRGAAIARGFFTFSALLTLCAAMIRTWAAAYLRSDVVQDPNLRVETIVADGPYRHVRNPLYLGSILLGLGFAFLASRTGFVVIFCGLTIFCLRLIGLEESRLEREQGERYREFCRRVPRLIPALMPRVAASGLKPEWGQAFLGESFMWGFFVGIAAFAITLKIVLTWIIIGFAMLFYIVRSYVLQARRKAAKAS